jgi:hypothetical protein
MAPDQHSQTRAPTQSKALCYSGKIFLRPDTSIAALDQDC